MQNMRSDESKLCSISEHEEVREKRLEEGSSTDSLGNSGDGQAEIKTFWGQIMKIIFYRQ